MQVASLGMRNKPISLQQLAKSSKLQTQLRIKVVIRQRNFEDMIPLNTTVSDCDLTAENGWVWVAADESVVFAELIKKDDGMSLLLVKGHNMMLTFLQEQKSIYLYLQFYVA